MQLRFLLTTAKDELKEPLFKLSTVWTELSLNLKLLEGCVIAKVAIRKCSCPEESFSKITFSDFRLTRAQKQNKGRIDESVIKPVY